MDSFENIRKRYFEITEKWTCQRSRVIINNRPNQELREHLEIDEDGSFSLVYFERGNIMNRRTTRSIDELLYWMAAEEARWYATDYEFQNQQPKLDTRRIMFVASEDYLGLVSAEWAVRLKQEHEDETEEYPFEDFPSLHCRAGNVL